MVRIATSEPDQRLRLVALAELAALSGPLVVDADDALELLAAGQGISLEAGVCRGGRPRSIDGAARRLQEQDNEGRHAPAVTDLVHAPSSGPRT
jgi:hypothetical protein